jgi:hypothetical protein
MSDANGGFPARAPGGFGGEWWVAAVMPTTAPAAATAHTATIP